MKLNQHEQARAAQRELRDAQLDLLPRGGSSSGSRMSFEFENRGGEVTDAELHYHGPHTLTMSPSGRLETNARGQIVLHQTEGVAVERPIRFDLAYTDRLGERRRIQFEIRENEGLRALNDPLIEPYPPA